MSRFFKTIKEDGPVVIAGITHIPFISLKEEKAGSAGSVTTAENISELKMYLADRIPIRSLMRLGLTQK